jgi:signal transduction histidine kinase
MLLISEKMASLGRLTAGIAHEMNTPLAATRAALKELTELTAEYVSSTGDAQVTPADHLEIAAEMQRSIDLATRAADRAASFVRSVKFQTRDLQPSERQQFDAVATIRDALLLLSYDVRKNGCSLSFEPSHERIQLYGSPTQLGQVITNLVTNAIDACVAKGGGPITVRLTRLGQAVSLQVTDQGCGIPPDNLRRIFDPMFTTKPLGRGTGLGLSIVHDVVTGEFGGTIHVDSEVGKGTAFTIDFIQPVETVDAAQTQN